MDRYLTAIIDIYHRLIRKEEPRSLTSDQERFLKLSKLLEEQRGLQRYVTSYRAITLDLATPVKKGLCGAVNFE